MTTFHSTRSTTDSLTSKQAIRKGIADDGGLFVTDSLGETHVDVASLAGKSYQQIAFDVLSVLLPDFSETELKACIDEAYGAQWSDEKITPVKPLGDDYVMELFNGPTSAFKDVALQILPRFMARTTPAGGDGNEKIMIVTATSGDTGKAALAGFADAEGTGITVFYPEGKVSQVQELQMSTQAGSNVNVCAVKGNFDDAQSAVKRIFGDRELANRLASDSHVVLSSANSINVGRLVPQVVYYFSAYAQLLEQRDALERQYAAIALAIETLGRADAELQSRFSPQLAQKAADYMDYLTDGRYDELVLARDLSAKARSTDDPTPRDTAYLSAGTADLLYLSVRLALCELTCPADDPCPLVLDDTLVNFDDARAGRAMALFREIAQHRQVILFTCHERDCPAQA